MLNVIEFGFKQKRERKAKNTLITNLTALSSILPENLFEPQQTELLLLQLKLDQLYIKLNVCLCDLEQNGLRRVSRIPVTFLN